MTNNTILVLAGDGVWPEVIKEALKVLQVVTECSAIDFSYEMELFGGGVGKVAPEAGLLQLRQSVDAYANLRPCRFPSESLRDLSVLRGSSADIAAVDFVLVRENCGGAYFGSKVEEEDFASDSWANSRVEVERIARVAIALLRAQDPPLSVISTEKANVLASGRLWRRVVGETFASDAPDVKLGHQLADSAAMLMMTGPLAFNGVLLADNTFGDILSDEASVIPGSLGLLPSASLSGIPSANTRVKGFYEPVHGSAPDIAGRGIASPVATILSVGMMLRYSFCLHKEADAVDNAVRKVLDAKALGGLETRTGDLGGSNSTEDVGNAVAKVLKEILLKET